MRLLSDVGSDSPACAFPRGQCPPGSGKRFLPLGLRPLKSASRDALKIRWKGEGVRITYSVDLVMMLPGTDEGR